MHFLLSFLSARFSKSGLILVQPGDGHHRRIWCGVPGICVTGVTPGPDLALFSMLKHDATVVRLRLLDGHFATEKHSVAKVALDSD
jgi:hypothetical protein